MPVSLKMYGSEVSVLLNRLGVPFGRIVTANQHTSLQVLTSIESAREFGVQLIQARATTSAELERVVLQMKRKGFLLTREEVFGLFATKADQKVLVSTDVDIEICSLVGCNLPAKIPHVYVKKNRATASRCLISLEQVLSETDCLVQKGAVSYEQGVALVAKGCGFGMIHAVSHISAMRGTSITEEEYSILMGSFFESRDTGSVENGFKN